MKISKITFNPRVACALVASAFIALGCAGGQQQEEDIVYSDQPQQQEQQEDDYVEATDEQQSESLAQGQEDAYSQQESTTQEANNEQEEVSQDLVTDYEEELAREDNPVPSGIASSGAQQNDAAEKASEWNSSTNDYSYDQGSTDDSTASTDTTAAEASLASYDDSSSSTSSYDSNAAYDNSAQTETASADTSDWKKKDAWQESSKSSSSNGVWTNTNGYNDNLTTQLEGNQRLYIVQKGDTLSKIAHKIYGAAGKWKELAQLNDISNANAIYPGDPIKFATSADSREFETAYDSIAKNTITVQPGDTLSGIAKQVLGDGQAWKFLYTLNKTEISNPNAITPNQVLYFYTRASYDQAFQQSAIKERFGH